MTSALPEDQRRELDDYQTPDWAIDAVLPFLLPRLGPGGGLILEPACGAGGIFRRLVASGVESHRMHGIEIHPERAAEARAGGFSVVAADALSPDTEWPSADLIISNPPFRQAEAFCRRALESVAFAGTVAMLLRLAFLESAERYEFHRRYPVNGLHVFSSRPSFTANGKTDSAAYAWFCWGAGQPGITVLPPHVAPRKKRTP